MVSQTFKQGRRHGFESGGGTILRVERANFFLPPFFGQCINQSELVGDVAVPVSARQAVLF